MSFKFPYYKNLKVFTAQYNTLIKQKRKTLNSIDIRLYETFLVFVWKTNSRNLHERFGNLLYVRTYRHGMLVL